MGITDVSAGNCGRERLLDRGCERGVHLGHEQRKDVGVVHAPFHASPGPEGLNRQLGQRVLHAPILPPLSNARFPASDAVIRPASRGSTVVDQFAGPTTERERTSPLSSMTVATTPALFAGLVDDVVGWLPTSDGNASAIAEHRLHRSAWYSGMVGLLVARASTVTDLRRAGSIEGLEIAVVADTGMDRLPETVASLAAAGATVRRVEAAVAKRGEDP